MDGSHHGFQDVHWPGWMPENAANYLLHTVRGIPIRELARRHGCHASTILRQVRRIESRRDEPLIDTALVRLGQALELEPEPEIHPTDRELADVATRILRRLCESGAVLAVGEAMPNAIVMRSEADGSGTRTAVMSAEAAQAMALCDWITFGTGGRVSRYHVSAAGRAALGQLLATAENERARACGGTGFAEGPSPFGQRDPSTGRQARRGRYAASAESPLIALSRRRDRDGKRFLDENMVRAGERLREDFELAQLATRKSAGDWPSFIAQGGSSCASAAERRLGAALDELGPGLADVALRCCCYLEGLERTEQRMGWSARSGKIVLRIALQRLSRHYAEAAQNGGNLIG